MKRVLFHIAMILTLTRLLVKLKWGTGFVRVALALYKAGLPMFGEPLAKFGTHIADSVQKELEDLGFPKNDTKN